MIQTGDRLVSVNSIEADAFDDDAIGSELNRADEGVFLFTRVVDGSLPNLEDSVEQ